MYNIIACHIFNQQSLILTDNLRCCLTNLYCNRKKGGIDKNCCSLYHSSQTMI